jgi:hypothetical protein
MDKTVKLALYAVLIVLACVFGHSFYSRYVRIMKAGSADAGTSAADVRVPDYTKPPPTNRVYSHMMMFGGAFFATVVVLGLFTAHEVSQLVAVKAVKTLYDDDGTEIHDPEYDRAEEVWANGDPLEAIRLMRAYLQKHPNAQFAAIRIAEIYEKDMQNPLAAILEYEEVLKHRLPPEKWGWTGIHLCNLYRRNGKADQAVALLRRIVLEYGRTAAAGKARKHLTQIDPTFVEEATTETQEAPAEINEEETKAVEPPAPVSNLPPGFRPKKT